jgi:hypothetical protein
MAEKSVRNMTVTTGSGKDVRDTGMLKGEASATKKATNETKQYTTGGISKGALGGRNTNS